MIKRITYFIFSLLIIQQMNCYSQDLTPPDKPNIRYVTIDTATNNVEIYWTPSDSSDVAWYILYYQYKFEDLDAYAIDSVSQDQTSYSFLMSGNQSYFYSIAAKDSSGAISVRTPGLHRPIHTKLLYDSCQNSIKISWNKYIGWDDNVSGYYLYEKKNNSPFVRLTGLQGIDSTYIHYGIENNTSYSYYVEAIKNDSLISRSNISSKYTYMPGPPEDLVLDLVTIPEMNKAEIHFHYSDTSSIYGFSLLRSSAISADFESVHQFFNPDKNSYILQNYILTNSEVFYYKIGSLNSCREVTKESNRGVNIVLSGINNGNNNILSWNEYIEWESGVEEYQLYRLEDSGDSILLVSLNPDARSYNDLLSDPSRSGLSGKIIYVIKAKKMGEELYSSSNHVSVEVTTDIFMPNAFTPNNDQHNDVFKPVVRFAPAKYTMIIYDRSGFPIFQSDNIDVGWDGTINGNAMAPQGVYVYHIQYTSFNGSKKSKTGTLTVFYP